MVMDDEGADADADLNLPTAIRNLIGMTHILEIKSHTYYEYGSFESFTYWKINPSESDEDTASSSTPTLTADEASPSFKRLATHHTVKTPSKPNEEKKKKGQSWKILTKLKCLLQEKTRRKRRGKLKYRPYTSMDTGSQNKHTITPTLTELLQSSVRIDSNTITRLDGKVYSYCGLRLTETPLGLSAVPVSYHNIVHPSHQCRNCNATMWYEEREEKSKNDVNPTFSLCCQGAALIVNDFGDGLPTRDIIVSSKDNGPKRMSKLHPSYMALQYPLLFPYGEDGFHDKIPYHSNTGGRKTKWGYVTMKEYYNYIIQQHPNESSTLLRGGRLFQQYLVDAYTTIEEQRLNWTRNNQDTLRNYQDAMALCRTYENPDLFITFTSNPKWPEISKMLAYFLGQESHDRPEIGTRIFKIKLTELLDDLTKKHVFGESRGVVYVIEFQKRGLPHAHILLWLEEHCKCMTPSDIDDIISVELPSPTDDPDAYKIVTDYMLHGPCGKDARNAACTTDGKCSKHFPKQFLAKTFLDEEGYPHYRRRDNKVTFKKGKFTYDNKHVVPRNRYVLLKYKAHINVEWWNRSKAINYLFKYLNKGLDRATIVIKENVKNGTTVASEKVLEVDEIKNYLNCRFLAPCESVWRLFSFDIHYSYPTVMQLSFHLPNQNEITLRDSEKLPALLEKEGINVTMFTDWFELNKHDPTARTHTYAKIPKHYVWHEKDKLWKQRKQRKCIGRIVYSSPVSGERYYLRMLLNVVRGVQGFEELMTVNNRLYATLKETCFAYGLLNDDKEWTHALSEASLWALDP
ncbi:ATP-dependent DNA helicase PIF1 [Tanacetum coccineum]